MHNNDVNKKVKALLSTPFPNELVRKLVKFLIKTYCRMRGKDFCRKLMASENNNHNLTKATRSEIAVVSNPNSYKKKKKPSKKDEKQNNENQENHDPNTYHMASAPPELDTNHTLLPETPTGLGIESLFSFFDRITNEIIDLSNVTNMEANLFQDIDNE